MRLAKMRELATNIVHVIDNDNYCRPVCGLTPPWTNTPDFIDDLSIGCPQCRTFIVDWLLGRGVSREARQIVHEDVERQPCDCGNVPVHPRSSHGATGTGQGPR